MKNINNDMLQKLFPNITDLVIYIELLDKIDYSYICAIQNLTIIINNKFKFSDMLCNNWRRLNQNMKCDIIYCINTAKGFNSHVMDKVITELNVTDAMDFPINIIVEFDESDISKIKSTMKYINSINRFVKSLYISTFLCDIDYEKGYEINISDFKYLESLVIRDENGLSKIIIKNCLKLEQIIINHEFENADLYLWNLPSLRHVDLLNDNFTIHNDDPDL